MKFIISFLMFCVSGFAISDNTESIMEKYQDKIFQIKVIDTKTNEKKSIGSGFLIGDEFTVVSNYHVISEMILESEKTKITLVKHSGEEKDLVLVDIDVINDLAYLRSSGALGEQL